MKLVFLLLVIFSLSTYSQQVPTSLSEVYKGEIKLDFSQSAEIQAGVWSGGTSMPYPRYFGGSIVYSQNNVSWLYIFGGDTSGRSATKVCLRYNVNTDSWDYINTLPTPMRVNSAARLGNKLYTMGGFDDASSDIAIKKFYEYDVNTKLWAGLPDLPEGMFYHKSFGYQDSLIYIVGGIRSDSSLFSSKVTLFNINTRQFREADPLPEQRADFALASIGNKFYITGGLYSKDSLSNKTIVAAIDQNDRARISYVLSEDSSKHYPIKVHSHFGYPSGIDSIVFFGGSNSIAFGPINNYYSLKIPETTYDTLRNVGFRATAFQSGYSYSFSNPGSDSILYVIVAGGVAPGPAISGTTCIYRDSLTATSVNIISDNIPSEFELLQNYPNPFNPSTIIQFSMPEQSFVKLEVYNSIGEKISTIVSDFLSAGNYKYEFNTTGRNLSSGIYFYRLIAGNFSDTKKFMLIK